MHRELIASLNGMPVEVSLHSSTPPNPWLGYKLALQRGLQDPTNATHVLVLQDDVVVCRNLTPALDRIIEIVPDDCVTLFHSYLPNNNKVALLKALTYGPPLIRSKYAKFWPVLCVLWPRAKAEHFLLWSETAKLPGGHRVASDDAVFGEWGRRHQETLWITVPSLIEHPDQVESLIGKRALWGRDKGRCALHFIGDCDPLEIDWSLTSSDPGVTVTASRGSA